MPSKQLRFILNKLLDSFASHDIHLLSTKDKDSAFMGCAALHDPLANSRVRIETIGAWELWAADRRAPDYRLKFGNSETPIQLIYRSPSIQISIVTPCRSTHGWFAVQTPWGHDRKCCFTCIARSLHSNLGLQAPPPSEWIMYMLLDSVSYINGPAPEERVPV